MRTICRRCSNRILFFYLFLTLGILSLGIALAFLLTPVKREYIREAKRSCSFEEAKKKLYEGPFKEDFYCGCPFNGDQVDRKSCGFWSEKYSNRVGGVEAEHVVPASTFGHAFPEYRKGDDRCRNRRGIPYGGRKCLLKISEEYRTIHNDLHNLRPSIGITNGDRSDLPYCEIPGDAKAYSGCNFENSGKCVEPRPEIRGNIARIYFYMMDQYPTRVGVEDEFRKMLDRWSNEDPVDAKECEIDEYIFSVQGNHNRFVYDKCQHPS